MRKLIMVVLMCSLLCGCAAGTPEYKKTIFAMDTVMDLTVYSDTNEPLAKAEDEIRRIERLIDRGNENSEIYKINKEKSAAVSEETASLLWSALEVSKMTDGAFDITIAPIMDLWGFYGGNFRVPSEDEILTTLQNIGYENIELGESLIFIPDDFKIDLGGIGKGYASDRTADILRENGVTSAIISLGGNVHAIGSKPDGTDWTVGITDPSDKDKSSLIGTLKVSDKAVITSGGYQRYFEQDGKTYHHIIDPKTGTSADSSLASVTVISKSGTEADGLSTALFVMGLEKSSELWRNSRSFEAVFADTDGKIYVTDGAKEYFDCYFDYSVIR